MFEDLTIQGKGSALAYLKVGSLTECVFEKLKWSRFQLVVFGACGGGHFIGWSAQPATGALVGILLLWDKRVVECIEEVVGTFSILCKLKYVLN